MAEVIAEDLLREQGGTTVGSAGVSAGPGAPASPQAVAAAAELGLGLEGHRSRPLTTELVATADEILTMTAAHRARVIEQWPEAAGKTQVLDPDFDVADPFGGSLADYRSTAEQIKTALLRRFQECAS